MSDYPHPSVAKSTVVCTNLGIIGLNQPRRIAIIRITIWIIPFCLCITRCQFGRQTCVDNEFSLKCFFHCANLISSNVLVSGLYLYGNPLGA